MKPRAAPWIVLLAGLLGACTAPPPREDPASACEARPACPPVPALVSLDQVPQWRAIAELLRAPDGPTIDGLLDVELSVAQAIDPGVDVAAARARVAAMAAAVGRALPRRCDARCKVAALNRYLFEVEGFRPVGDLDRLYNDVRRDLLPHVIASREGYCVGLSHLYATVGARLGLRLSIVPRRQHEFVRVVAEDGATLDVDPTRRGAPPPAERPCADAAPVFDRALTPRAVAARTLAFAGLADGFAALPWLDAAADLDATDPDLFNNRGSHRMRRGDVEGALDDFRRASSLDPCTAVYGVNEAGALWTLGRREASLARLDALSRGVSPEGQLLVEVQRAVALFEDRRDAEADAALLRALERWAGAPTILEARASMRLAQGRAPEAVRDARAALAADDDAGRHADLLVAALAAGDLATAERALVDLEARSPIEGTTDLHRALVEAARGDDALAERHARGCLARYGRRCTRGLAVLAEVARARGQGACARRYAEAYLSCPRAPFDRRQQAFDASVRARFVR